MKRRAHAVGVRHSREGVAAALGIESTSTPNGRKADSERLGSCVGAAVVTCYKFA